MATIAGLLGHP